MKELRKYAKYVLWIVLFLIFTNFLIFVGFNTDYKKITPRENLPEQISIDKAEATDSNGRIYGKIKNIESNNLNGKYIKILIFNEKNENIDTEYLYIEDLKVNEEKSFQSTFTAKNAKSFEINIVENK